MKLDKKYRILLQGALIFVWLTDLSPLTQTDTYYSVYLLCGLAGSWEILSCTSPFPPCKAS